ncbi:MAG: parallel beta-helix domain-containing protein [Alphaproteobacteria bacterium]|nr:parallel beta-helix domain-containing protein [Alphaproteobacteria bacterium]
MLRILAAGACGALLLSTPAEAKTWRVRPGPDAQTVLQTALIEAKPGDSVRLARGRFELTAGLSLDVDRVSIQGEGADKSILSFSGQTGGAEGLLVTADDVVLRNFAVENARGDGIKSKDADRITFRDLRIEWTRGPHRDNGAYGVYPVGSRDVLIDRVTVRGASDAGIYVGQSQNIIVRRSLAEFNVAGIEIENSINADVFDNITRRNTGGILVFDLPGVPQTGGHSTRVFRNQIVQNDTPNFAPAGNIVAGVPTGTGVIVMANRNVHIFENTIAENGTANVIITAYRQEITDATYNPLPRDIVIRNNIFGRGGFAPAGDFAALRQAGVPFGDVLWDGTTIFVGAGRPREEPVRISIRDNRSTTNRPLSFLSLGLSIASSPMTDAQPDATMPGPLAIAEPAPVRVPQD